MSVFAHYARTLSRAHEIGVSHRFTEIHQRLVKRGVDPMLAVDAAFDEARSYVRDAKATAVRYRVLRDTTRRRGGSA